MTFAQRRVAQALVESALVLPLVVTLSLGVLQVVLYAIVPQIIPDFISYTIYHWDINVRISTIIGYVGGGGSGRT